MTEVSLLKHHVSIWNSEQLKKSPDSQLAKTSAEGALAICKSNQVAEAEFRAKWPDFALVLDKIKELPVSPRGKEEGKVKEV